MKPAIQYPGSKVMLSGRIAGLFPRHGSYVEPYFGSGAVLLAKSPVAVERVNDVNGDLVHFYRTLRDPATRYSLIDALAFTPYAREEVTLAQQPVEDLGNDAANDVERARRFMVRMNQTYVGGGGGWTATTKASSGHSNASKWNNYRTRVHAIAERLQNVQIDRTDALDVLAQVARADDPNLAVYADPPYLMSTRNGSKYASEIGVEHHEKMLSTLLELPGPVILSGYPSEMYDTALDGWHRIALDRKANGQAGKGSSVNRTEVLWLNFQPNTNKEIHP